MANKNIITTSINDSFAKRPDIYLENRTEKKAYIIDVTIMTEDKISRAYIKKVTKYWALQEKVRRERDMRYVRIIPVVFTINGFVHKKSITELKKELQLKIDYAAIIKNTLIKEMKDLMYYVANENPLYLQSNASLDLLREDRTLTQEQGYHEQL